MADYLPAFRGCPVNLLHSQNKIFARGPNHFFHTAIPSASRLQNGFGGNAQDRETKALNLCASLPGEAQVALAGLDQ